MDGIVRRPSGVYVARLTVPKRLRPLVGKRELIATTGVRDLAVARIVGGHLLTTWRQRLLELERMQMGAEIDVLRALEGSPQLALGGHLPLTEAALASGIGQDTLLRAAAERRLTLYFHANSVPGYRVAFDALAHDVPGDEGRTGRVIPLARRMPEDARQLTYTGVLALPASAEIASGLLAGETVDIVVLAIPGGGQDVFIPDRELALTRGEVMLAAADVERQRRRIAQVITPDQVDGAKAVRAKASAEVPPQRQQRISESIESFLADHKRPRGSEQTGRVRSACRLFIELMGHDLRGSDLNREVVRRFRDIELPRLPEHENKVRLTKGSKSVLESIRAIEGTTWPRMSAAQQVKRMNWIGDWLTWLHNEGWAEEDYGKGMVGGGTSGRSATAGRRLRSQQELRDCFSPEELELIFSTPWLQSGRGSLTAAGTYRTWMPYRNWMPLIALLTGCRINEIAQLNLRDIRCNVAGVWIFEITTEDESDAPKLKKLKNAQSRRLLPVHSELVRIGLIEWRNRLEREGFDRLFPELLHDDGKGYGKAATKWFSGHFKSLGMPRDLRKVFHSFRHNVGDLLENHADVRPHLASQILGHVRGTNTTQTTYRKDVEVAGPNSPVVRAVELLKFECLARVAPFDCDAGIQAVRDALRRKRA